MVDERRFGTADDPRAFPWPSAEDVERKWAEEHARWERKFLRQRRIANWCLIPYVTCCVLTGWGITRVQDVLTFILLLTGVAGTALLSWIQPFVVGMLDRRDDAKRG